MGVYIWMNQLVPYSEDPANRARMIVVEQAGGLGTGRDSEMETNTDAAG